MKYKKIYILLYTIIVFSLFQNVFGISEDCQKLNKFLSNTSLDCCSITGEANCQSDDFVVTNLK